MPDKPADELADLAAIFRNHLQFLEDIGVREIGEPGSTAHHSPRTNSRQKSAKEGGGSSRGPECDLPPPAAIEAATHADDLSMSAAANAAATGGGATQENAVQLHLRERGNSDDSGNPSDRPRPEPAPIQQLDLFGEPVATTAPQDRRPKPAPATASLFDTLPADSLLEDIRNDIGDCTRCKLCSHRTRIVFGEGNPKADLVFVGEGPGADEDATGRPFVGRAGKLLDKIIEAMELKRSDVYICNVVKCRPPENRTPEPDEVETCQNFLFRQLKLIRPKVVVALGAPALHCLTGTREGITKARGQWRDWNGLKLIATYHPSYLLRVPPKKRETWEDIKRVRDYLATH